MPPQQDPLSPQTAAPAPNPLPQPAGPQFAQPQYGGSMSAVPPVEPKRRGKLFVAGIAAAVIIVILAFLVLLAVPTLQAHGEANSFMKKATSGSLAEAKEAIGGTNNDALAQGVADSMHGSFKQIESAHQNDKWYFLYELTGAKSKYARIIIEKQDGKLATTSIVYGNTKLSLIPGSSTATTNATSITSPTSASSASACLSNTDYKYLSYDKSEPTVTYDTTYDATGLTTNATVDMFFKPDVTDEDSLTSLYDDVADFATHNANKQWKLRLEGSTYGSDATTAAAKQLATARTDKVVAELTKRGVPADRIIKDAPHDYSTESQDSQVDGIYRRVQMIVDPTCSSTSATNANR